jgi:uncharacterized protein (TIGR00251 family)
VADAAPGTTPGAGSHEGPDAERDGRVHVALKVVPGASASRIVGRLGERLKLAVAAPAERGAANAEVCRLLAKRLRVKPSSVVLVTGQTSPQKTASVPFANMADVQRLLEPTVPKEDPSP